MAPPLINLQSIALTFGGAPVLEAADLAVSTGERLCLVGRNGSGKSTLLKIAAGLVEADSGERFVQPGATIRYLPQEPDLSGFSTVLAYVEAGLDPSDDPYRAHRLIADLGLRPDAAPAQLSGGEARRAALARALAPAPDVLLLDEPTNHLDLPAIEWLEAELSALRAAMVIISHDRRLLQNLSRVTVWLDRGRTRRLDRGFVAFEEWRDTVLEQEELEHHKLERQIVREEHWVRFGVTARRKRNMRRMRELAELRRAHRDARRVEGEVRLTMSEADASGAQVIVAEHVSKAFAGRVIVKNLSLRLLRRDRLAVVGPNGAGKTTILNLLMGRIAPDSGEIRRGTNLAPIIIEQDRASLDPARSVQDTLTGGRGDVVSVNGALRHVVGYLRDFLFAPEQARQPVGALSGGERARLLLARSLATSSNLLVLDEPTNDLDLETLDLLEEHLADYAGTILLVSHDRDFLDRVATSVLMSEGKGRWIEYAGGYADMVAQRGAGIETSKAEVRATPRAPSPPASLPGRVQAKPRLSFKEKRALETLPGQIDALVARIRDLNAELADPALYARDAAGARTAAAALTQAQAELAAAEDEWLALEARREEAER
ncbi:MAG: ATP-binding cassette domain-containing protein [Alphaproteobacteria bacterium]|nr:ATP-binding cassette domain-containing protein [Alphaproteobacteria bacterium]